jgi:hypothetical protein
MKSLKLIFASLIISFGVNAQKATQKKMDRNYLSPEQKAKFQTEKMKTELNLSNEQYDKAYQINMGIVQKNKSLEDQKMTTYERENAVKQNKEARILMLKEVLSAEQFNKMQENLKENKQADKE